jgi:Fe2+ transport system protein B
MESIKNVKHKVDKMAYSIESIVNNGSDISKHIQLIKQLIQSNDVKTLADGVVTIYSIVDTENKLIKKSIKELTHNLVDLHQEHLILIIEMKQDLNNLKQNSTKTKSQKNNQTNTIVSMLDKIISNPIKSSFIVVFTILSVFGGLMLLSKLDKEAFSKTTNVIKIIKDEK